MFRNPYFGSRESQRNAADEPCRPKGRLARRSAVGAVAVLTIVAALTVGVSTTAATERQRQETITLRFLAGATQQPPFEFMIKNFERVYPNIKIDAQFVPSGTAIGPLLLTQFQAGNAPDIFQVLAGGRSAGIWQLAEAKRLLNLTGRKWQPRIHPPSKAAVSYQGKVYGWPLEVLTYGIVYNPDMFRQLGLKVPTRFSQVLTMCRRITAAGKIPFVQAWGTQAAATIVGRVMMDEFVMSIDPTWSTKRAKKRVTFAGSPLWRRAFNVIVAMKNAGCFQPGATGTSRSQQYTLFARGEAAMSIIAASEVGAILQVNRDTKHPMVPFPSDNPKNTVVSTAATQNIAANAQTKFPGAARLFIDFIAREQQSRLFSKVSGAIAPLDAKKGLLPAYMKAGMGPLFAAGRVRGGSEAEWRNSRAWDEGVAGLLGLFTGQTTVPSILQKMDELFDTPPAG